MVEEVPDGVLAEHSALEVLGEAVGFIGFVVTAPLGAGVVVGELGDGLTGGLVAVEGRLELLHGLGGLAEQGFHVLDALDLVHGVACG